MKPGASSQVLALRETASERGAVVIVLAVAALFLVALVGIVISTSYNNLIRSELQAAADASALAGAEILCSQPSCYADATEAAIRILNRHTAHADQGERPIIFADPESGPIWDNGGDLRVSVFRGRWWPNGAPENIDTLSGHPKFESFDDQQADWQELHPGLPAFLASNAVYVRVERRQVSLFFSPFGGGKYEVMAEAVATGGEIGAVCMAPMAIHVCSLLDTEGKFSPERHCKHDLLFTRSDCYCTDEEDCEVLPGFAWHPTLETELRGMWSQLEFGTTCGDVGGCVDYQDKILACRFREGFKAPMKYDFHSGHIYGYDTPSQAQSISDYFGVIGVPADEDGSDEATIRNILQNNPDGCMWATIGQEFQLVSQGLTERATDDVLWNQISSGPDKKHPRYKETELYRMQKLIRWEDNVWPCDQAENQKYERWGMCNSRRMYYDDRCKYDEKEFCDTARPLIGPNTTHNFHTPCKGEGDYGNTSVWQVSVAVVADNESDAQGCQGMEISGEKPDSDPTLTSARRYHIVGFVKVNVFDTDIGNPAPQPPSTCDYDQNRTPWGFTKNGGACNLIRGRLMCDTELIPSSEHVSQSKPVLVR